MAGPAGSAAVANIDACILDKANTGSITVLHGPAGI